MITFLQLINVNMFQVGKSKCLVFHMRTSRQTVDYDLLKNTIDEGDDKRKFRKNWNERKKRSQNTATDRIIMERFKRRLKKH